MNRRTLFARAALILTLAFAGLAGGTAPAQTVQIGHQNVNLATLPLFPPEAVPRLGTFFSIHRAGGPPLPGLPPAYATAGLPVYWLGGNRYLVDDTSLDWATIEAERRLAQTAAAALSANSLSLLDGGGAGMMSSSYGSNDLWLELVAVTNGTALLLAHPPETGAAYDLFQSSALASNVWTWVARGLQGQTEFSVTNLPPDGAFYILGTMAGLDAHGVTTAYRSLVGGDETLANDTDNDGLRDAWEILHFGNLDQDGYGDYDGDSADNLTEFYAGTDPNTIHFTGHVSYGHVATLTPTATVDVLAGAPAALAVIVDSTNFASAQWQPFSVSPTFSLPSADGAHAVWLGLRGCPEDASPTWLGFTVVLDRAAPAVVITGPVPGTTAKPVVQLQGYSPEPLWSVSCNLSNAAGSWTNLPGFLTGAQGPTNFFKCFDLELTNGLNVLSVAVTDLAGNTTATNLDLTLDLASDTNAPVVDIYWPQNETQVGASEFTLRGRVDDETASVIGEIVGASGATNRVQGVVERNGAMWVDNLPLEDGTNALTLTVADAAGNLSVTNLAVVRSDVTLTIQDLPPALLAGPRVSVSGTISSDDYKVWVNGVPAMPTNGVWLAVDVPVTRGGTAVFAVTAIPLSDNAGNGTQPLGQGTDPAGSNPTGTNAVSAAAQPGKDAEVVLVRGEWKTWDVTLYPASQYARNYEWSWSEEEGGQASSAHTEPLVEALLGRGLRYWRSTNGSERFELWLFSPTNIISTGPAWLEDHFWHGFSLQRPWARGDWKSFRPEGANWRWLSSSAETNQVVLRTGGRAGLRRNNSLFVVSAIVVEKTQDGGRVIDPTQVFIPGLGKHLGTDHRACAALPDGEEVLLTPVAPAAYYNFDNLGAVKHRLVHETRCTAYADSNRSRTSLGVGEEVDFRFDPPWDLTAQDQPWWVAFAGSVAPSSGVGTTFTAPSNAANATVRVTIRDVQMETVFGVKEPSGVDHAVVQQTYQMNGYGTITWGADARLRVIIAPTDVSFSRVEIEEVGQYATDVSGRYALFTNSCYTPEQLRHISDTFRPISCDNRWNPYAAYGMEGDHVRASMNPPLCAGSYTWPIPANWRIPGGATNPLSGWSPQVVTVDSNGVTRITKFGIWVERSTNDVYTIGP